MNLLELLKSKPHNLHYINRYYKFITHFKNKNTNNIKDKLIKHHILPKATDMFPEYSKFKDYTWNLCKMNKRQHEIAHLLLYKAYRTKSQCYAYKQLINFSRTNKKGVIAKKLDDTIKQYLKGDISTKPGFTTKGTVSIYNIKTSEYSRINKGDILPDNCIYQGANKGKRIKPNNIQTYHDPVTHKEYNLDINFSIPNNLVKGRSEKFCARVRETSTGNKSNTNKILWSNPNSGTSIYLSELDSVPDGYIRGMSELHKISVSKTKINNESSKGEKNPNYGKINYYDPVTNINFRFKIGEVIPDNLIKGTSPIFKLKISEKLKLIRKTNSLHIHKIILKDKSEHLFELGCDLSEFCRSKNIIFKLKFYNIGIITKDNINSQKINAYKNTFGCEFIREKMEK